MPTSRPSKLFSSGAVRMGLAISLATGLYGISFGALSVAAGLDMVQTQLLSALMFTGGSQFAFIGTLAGGGGAAVLAASLLGVRNAVYGAQLNATLRPRSSVVPVMALLSIDESFATAMSQAKPVERRRGFWTAGIGVWVLWNFFTFLGAWAGEALGDPKQWGLDGAASAAFLGLLWPRLKRLDAVAVAAVSAVAVTVLAPFLPPGIPLLVGGLAAVLAHLVMSRKKTPGDKEGKSASGTLSTSQSGQRHSHGPGHQPATQSDDITTPHTGTLNHGLDEQSAQSQDNPPTQEAS